MEPAVKDAGQSERSLAAMQGELLSFARRFPTNNPASTKLPGDREVVLAAENFNIPSIRAELMHSLQAI